MNRISIIAILFFILPWTTLATGQAGDILIRNGDTLVLFSNPLETYPNIKSIRTKLFGEEKLSWNTSCWRGYRAEWILEDDTLYLQKIYSCDYPNDTVQSDLNELFGKDCICGKVAATWVNQELYVQIGKCLLYVHSGYESIYEKEIGLDIKYGILINEKIYDNTGTHISKYYQNSELLEEELIRKICWNNVPNLGSDEIIVYLTVRSGSEPRPEQIELLKPSDKEELNKEAIKAVEKLSDWDVFYKGGQIKELMTGIPIKFSEVNRSRSIIEN